MIIPSYGLTATERVLPRLALDWTTGLAQPGVDVTRAGVSTYVDSDGLIKIASSDTQRVDWSKTLPGLLIEESKVNLVTYSQDFRNTTDAGATRPWLYGSSSVVYNSVNSPDGTQNACTLLDNTVNDLHSLGIAITTTAAPYTFSIFGKPAGRNFLWLRLPNTAGTFRYAWFNLATGQVANVFSGITAQIESAADGFYRCSITIPEAFAGAQVIRFGCSPADNTLAYVGNGANGIHVYGAQIEQSAFPTSYIPTSGSAVTRNADVVTMTGTNFSDWFNPTEGTFVTSFNVNHAQTVDGQVLYVGDGTTSNVMAAQQLTSTNNVSYTVNTGGVSQASLTLGTASLTAKNTVSFRYKANNFAGALNAGASTSDLSGTVPTCSQLVIGNYAGLARYINGTIGKVFFYNQALTGAELQAFSKG